MKNLFVLVTIVGVMLMTSGCGTMIGLNSFNSKVSTAKADQAFRGHNNALKAVPMDNGTPGVGIDWAALSPGYLNWWATTPGTAAAYTGADLVTAAAGIYAYSKSKSSSGGSTPAIQVNGNGNDTTVITGGSGSGSTTYNGGRNQSGTP